MRLRGLGLPFSLYRWALLYSAVSVACHLLAATVVGSRRPGRTPGSGKRASTERTMTMTVAVAAAGTAAGSVAAGTAAGTVAAGTAHTAGSVAVRASGTVVASARGMQVTALGIRATAG